MKETRVDECIRVKCYGRWTVLGKGGKKNHVSCVCTCGNTKLVAVSSLIHGASKSCGCLSKELASKRMVDKGTMEVGQVYSTTSEEDIEVVEYIDCDNVKVRFIKSGYEVYTTAGTIRKGLVRNPMRRSVCGVGYIGIGKYQKHNSEEAYSHWSHMISRCYSDNYGITYKECRVTEDWHCFQNFAKWFDDNKKDYKGALDKDLLCKGNKLYCPEYCEIVPPDLNNFSCKSKTIRGELPIGVVKDDRLGKVRYIAQVYFKGIYEYLGLYESVNEAFGIYKCRKEDIAKQLAEEYFSEGKISRKMYKALYNYEVNITD